MKTNYVYTISNKLNGLFFTFTLSDVICMELNSEKSFFALSFLSGKDYIIGNNFSIDFLKIKSLYNEINKNFIDFKSGNGPIGDSIFEEKQL